MFSGETETVELCCGRELIEEILDRFGDTALLRTAGEGKFLVKFEAKVSEGLISWLMQYGDRAVVRSPQKLKEMILEKAKDIYQNYAL